MSVFPKKTARGGRIFLHTSYNFENRPHAISVKCEMINPLSVSEKLFTKDFIFFPKKKENYLRSKNSYVKGHSGLIYAKFLQHEFTSNSDLGILYQRFTMASHEYCHIEIDPSFSLGKYYIKTYTYIDGLKLQSTSQDSDYFLVEELEIESKRKGFYVVNKSPEKISFRIVYIDNYNETVMSIEGKTELLLPPSLKLNNAFIIYAEDQKILSLFPTTLVYRNPKVQHTKFGNKTLLNLNDCDCFQIDGEMQDLWDALHLIGNKKELLNRFSKELYLELYSNNLICESVMEN